MIDRGGCPIPPRRQDLLHSLRSSQPYHDGEALLSFVATFLASWNPQTPRVHIASGERGEMALVVGYELEVVAPTDH